MVSRSSLSGRKSELDLSSKFLVEEERGKFGDGGQLVCLPLLLLKGPYLEVSVLRMRPRNRSEAFGGRGLARDPFLN